jgi:predicted nucleotidyltransferase component of viral defense system
MSIPALDHFSLVGGTALALRFGHRKSVDLDLFSTKEFDNEVLANDIAANFPEIEFRSLKNPIGLFGYIGDLKVDFVRHHHKQLRLMVYDEGIRMFANEDIMAMKIFAVLKRAVKKDFWDVAELLNHYKIEDFIACYTKKYPTNTMLISIPHALTYFTDAEESEEPVSLKGQTWESVKGTISDAVREYLK